jgi:hypothetical protein
MESQQEFFDTLEKIHQKQGIILQREPILGGQKLDLYRIFQIVQQNGGYQRV